MLLDIVAQAWGWTGVTPIAVLAQNAFGNLILRDKAGRHWRLCPEELRLVQLGETDDAYERQSHDPLFVRDWEMANLVAVAERSTGHLEPGQCYSFSQLPALGGTYDADNITSTSLAEWIAFTGDVARQLQDVPDGMRVKFRIVE